MRCSQQRAAVAALAGAIAVSLAGCVSSGERFAAELAERVVIGIGDDITPAYPTPLEADYLAAWAIRDPRLPVVEPEVDYLVEALEWEGNSGDESGARIQLRITVHVHAKSGGAIGSPDYAEGRSTRCWELTVFGLHDYDSLGQREIGCPDGAAPAPPDPDPLPQLPVDVEERLTAALEDATAANIDQRVLAAFPEDYYSVESQARNGELAVALGIPSQSECVVGVEHADGSIEMLRGWQDVVLQPGETGCSPDLYFAPVTTH